jgi:hypothetical protein
MLTVGGLIGTELDERALTKAGIFLHRFVRKNEDHLTISVPPLTFREKQWLDCSLYGKLTADKLCFELDEEFIGVSPVISGSPSSRISSALRCAKSSFTCCDVASGDGPAGTVL